MAKRNNSKNPANPDSNLYKKLTRLFSGPIVNYRKQNVRRDKRNRLDKYSSTFKTASGQQFKKKSYNPYDNLMANQMVNQNRVERYADFDQMEYTPELASALDIYADEITTHNGYESLVKIVCPNEEIKEILHTLYYQVLNIEFNLFGYARTMCKYGDYFLFMDIDEKLGIKSVIGLPPEEIERLEGEDPTNPNYLQYQWNSAGLTFENWQIGHFRVLGNDKYSPYGTSVFDPARRIWRQLTLMEDAMMAYRIVRAPDRRVFYIDVGGVPPEDVEQFMQKVMTQMKRHQVIDSKTGRVDLRYNPASIEEDYYIPVRGGQTGTKIDTVGGQARANDIEDVKYLRDKMFAALKIPASYLSRGADSGAGEDKTTLAQKDIRFARTIQRLQRSIVSELEKIGIVHLYTLGYRGDDLVSFKLSLSNPSKIAQLQELENLRVKFELAAAAGESMFSQRWISQNVFDISEEEFVRNQRERFYDKKLNAAMSKIAELAGTAAEAGAFGGISPTADIETPDLGAPEEAALEAPEAAGPEATPEPPTPAEDEGVLLATPSPAAAPAKRDEDWYKLKDKKNNKTTTSSSKGKWYSPVATDKRSMGARRKNMKSLGGAPQQGIRHSHKGYHDLKGLGTGIVSEAQANYSDVVENKILGASNDFELLIKSLENKNEDES